MADKKRKEPEPINPDDFPDVVEVTPLGAGQEVGRSCIVLKYRGRMVMLDCGIHPGLTGMDALPFFDRVDMSKVDVIVVTHFHLDHCAALPYVVAHTTFKGRIVMTHPTKSIYATLLNDFVKVSHGSSEQALYSADDLKTSLARIELADFYQTLDFDGISITLYRAGHVLGAAMAYVEIEGFKALYTGDYSRVADRHLAGADVPPVPPDMRTIGQRSDTISVLATTTTTVIVEATYGVNRHLPREDREKRFTTQIATIVKRGGRCLLPVVALGRAQELLLILEEYWERHPELANVPIYQTSGLARRAMTIFQTYIEMMSEDIRAAFQVSNPFVLKHVTHLKSGNAFDDVGPCVVLATPSMLQSGLSRELFEAWCEDRRNGIIIADFAVAGTLAKEILSEPAEITTRAGIRVPLRASVEHISFSAHADFAQTSEFVELLNPPHVTLVHGEKTEMARLAKALKQQSDVLKQPRDIYTPGNGQSVLLRHTPRRPAVVVGAMAAAPLQSGQALRGLLVARDEAGTDARIMLPEDLACYTTMKMCRIRQRQAVPLRRPFEEVRAQLQLLIEGVEGTGDIGTIEGETLPGGGCVLRIAQTVTLTHRPAEGQMQQHVVLEWQAGTAADMVADAVVAVILQAGEEPPAVRRAEKRWRIALEQGADEAVQEAQTELLAAMLAAQFGPVKVTAPGSLVVRLDDVVASVDVATGAVDCPSDEGLAARIAKAVQRIEAAWRPVAMMGAEG